MSEAPSRILLYEDLLRRMASGVRNSTLYAVDHPLVARNMVGLVGVLATLHQQQHSITVGIVGSDLVVADTPMHKISTTMTELIRKFKDNKVERIAFERGVTQDELAALLQNLARLSTKGGDTEKELSSAHIRVGRLKSEDEKKRDGLASDIAAIRQMYAGAVETAEVVWESAEKEGVPDAPAALQTVDGLADAVTQNRTALMALTAMRNYDNYTFTHMVNVSILAMAQARALGIDGKLLREFGMSALMHDIGKVRTPKEILNKPGKLTDDEFVIMRRHVVDGAEILRRTPEMPILAPIVAFEHHLRLDGSGYPSIARRDAMNLGSMLCAISDVYDAMRSQRAYQQAHPTDRILAVLRRNEGSQLDPHLVRRFVQILGIYPPGNLVKLSTGEIAVVLHVHAPDPRRPRVRVLFNAEGARLELPFERNLWEPQRDRGGPGLPSVVAPVDPADYHIDPLNFLEN
ncbi:MAG TPA: HD domain-containing phosphohydrolase [Vicinamibacterales bacterium]|nr:HD domain-containing phosphohydrolase [Vicinamibacterales bacterium]